MSRYIPRHHVNSTVIVSAVRYGMGRMTYADSDARDLVRIHWAEMHPTDQQVVREDIRSHVQLAKVFCRDDEHANARHWREQYGRWKYLLDHLDDDEMPAEPLGIPIYEETKDA